MLFLLTWRRLYVVYSTALAIRAKLLANKLF